MREQEAGGHIFNMDGAGADGSPTPRFAAYGATKRGLVQLSKSLQAELKMLGISNVGIHNLSPGMVTTDLLMSGMFCLCADNVMECSLILMEPLLQLCLLKCAIPLPAAKFKVCLADSRKSGGNLRVEKGLVDLVSAIFHDVFEVPRPRVERSGH